MTQQPTMRPTATEPERFCRRCGYELRGLSKPCCPECGLAFDPANPHTYYMKRPKSSVPFILGIVAGIVGLAGNAGAMLVAASLWSIPPGTSIRPMAQAALMFLIALGTAVVGGALGVIGIAKGPKRWAIWIIATLGIVLSLMPYFTSNLVWDSIVTRHGLVMEP